MRFDQHVDGQVRASGHPGMSRHQLCGLCELRRALDFGYDEIGQPSGSQPADGRHVLLEIGTVDIVDPGANATERILTARDQAADQLGMSSLVPGCRAIFAIERNVKTGPSVC